MMKKMTGIMAIALMLALAMTGCSKSGGGGGGSSGGGKSINSATELKEYLDKQPANSPDKPIKVAMKVNDMMIGQENDIAKVINDAGKYVSLDLSGSPLTTIPDYAFYGCQTLAGIIIPNGVTTIEFSAFDRSGLTSITIPNSVTSIMGRAFRGCTTLTSITIPNSVTFVGGYAFEEWTASQTINIQGKANREATIAAGWDEHWDINYLDFGSRKEEIPVQIEAQINYGK